MVYSAVYSGADQRKHQSSSSLAFVRGIHRWPVNSPHKGPVMRTMFPFDDVFLQWQQSFPLLRCVGRKICASVSVTSLRRDMALWFSWHTIDCSISHPIKIKKISSLLAPWSTLVQVMAWHLPDTKPLPKGNQCCFIGHLRPCEQS